MAEQDRNESAGEQELPGRAELRVARDPLRIVCPALALEVDTDRSPVADDVVEQEARGTSFFGPLL
jgi:hypothetical protein